MLANIISWVNSRNHIPLLLKASELFFALLKYQLEGNGLKCDQAVEASGRGQRKRRSLSSSGWVSEVSESVPPNPKPLSTEK